MPSPIIFVNAYELSSQTYSLFILTRQSRRQVLTRVIQLDSHVNLLIGVINIQVSYVSHYTRQVPIHKYPVSDLYVKVDVLLLDLRPVQGLAEDGHAVGAWATVGVAAQRGDSRITLNEQQTHHILSEIYWQRCHHAAGGYNYTARGRGCTGRATVRKPSVPCRK